MEIPNRNFTVMLNGEDITNEVESVGYLPQDKHIPPASYIHPTMFRVKFSTGDIVEVSSSVLEVIYAEQPIEILDLKETK